jgi:hypothetical protein
VDFSVILQRIHHLRVSLTRYRLNGRHRGSGLSIDRSSGILSGLATIADVKFAAFDISSHPMLIYVLGFDRWAMLIYVLG